jgi:hypothetical protein
MLLDFSSPNSFRSFSEGNALLFWGARIRLACGIRAKQVLDRPRRATSIAKANLIIVGDASDRSRKRLRVSFCKRGVASVTSLR